MIWYPALVFSVVIPTILPQQSTKCVCVVYLLPVNERFLLWWTHACTEQKGAAAGQGWPCWHPCGWGNRCWAKISIKSGKVLRLKWGKPLYWVNMAKVTVTGPHLSTMTDKIFVDDIWVCGDLNALTCGYYTSSGKQQVATPWVSRITNFFTIDQNTFKMADRILKRGGLLGWPSV